MFSTKDVNTQPLSQKAILDRVSEYDLWMFYLGHCTFNKAFKSPVRKDNRPSAVLYVSSAGKILLKDFGTKQVMDIFRYLEALGYTYKEVLLKIDADFKLGFSNQVYDKKSRPVITNYKPEFKRDMCNIMIKRAPWTESTYGYWKDYSISKSTLERFKVYSLECYWLVKNGKTEIYESKKNPIYCYDFGDQKYKIYKPLDHNFRFMTNADNNILQGINQLAQEDDLLIITKSLKDVMVLSELGYNAVAVQSENSLPERHVIDSLKLRFNVIKVLFDNDPAGIQGSEKICQVHDLQSIMIPKEYKTKDIAEFVKLHGEKQAKTLIKCLTETELQVTIGKEKL